MRPTPRPVAASVDEMLAGAVRLGEFRPADNRSLAAFERVIVDGEHCIVKYLHPDLDFALRACGDIGSITLRAWADGLMDAVPATIDHATISAAPWGRNGWGAALLMRDVSGWLLLENDQPVDEDAHLGCLDALAALSARFWEWPDDFGLLPYELRWQFFSPQVIASEEQLGFPEAVPRIAAEGWRRFVERAPRSVAVAIAELHHDATSLTTALASTPSTLLHGDWKFGNLGRGADGRTILLDWAYVGAGPVCHELGWYVALNRSRLPVGHTKESTIDGLREALERHGVATAGWWDRQLGLCLLGTVVQFGWEKALGDDDELGWWCDRAGEGLAWL